MEGEQYQNWIWHTLYFLERRNAPKGKITGMVTREKLIQFIQELEKEAWEKYHAYLMLESITLKYSFSTRRSLKMKQDLLKAVEYAVNTTATIL